MEAVQECQKVKLLLISHDEDIGMKSKRVRLEKRKAARAVLLEGKKIALLHVTKQKYHKLPGGGIEKGESIKSALLREVKEETGCRIKIISEIGKIIEHRTRLGFLSGIVQTSYCFLAKVTEVGEPEFDAGERSAGYRLEWKSIDSAIKLLKKEKPQDYEGKFIVIRDLKLIETAKKAKKL